MSIKLVDDTKITAIGNAIRTKGSTQALLTLDQMPQAIADLPSGGGTDKITNRISMDRYNSGALNYSVAASDFYVNNGGYLKQDAFSRDKNLVSVELPSNIIGLYTGCFLECTNLASVTINGNLMQICNNFGSEVGTFRYCTSLESLTIPLGSQCIIYADAFQYCTALETVTFVNNYNCDLQITGPSFGYCSSLTSIDFDDARLTFSGNVFDGCTALEECDLGANVQSLSGPYSHPFISCSNMKKLIIRNASTVPTLGNGGIFSYSSGSVPSGFVGIFVADALVDSYKSSTNWSLFESYIKPISELV